MCWYKCPERKETCLTLAFVKTMSLKEHTTIF